MAWISIDQKLIGGKLRTLYKAIGCSRNEAIGILVTLWLWGIDNAEMNGLIPSADRSDIAEVLRPGISENLDPEIVADCLIKNGWIDDCSGQLHLHNWTEWRSYYNRYVKDKQSNNERQARYKARHKEEGNGDGNVINNGENNVTISEPDENFAAQGKEVKKPDKYGKDFEEFWKIYPRKADKGACYKKYKARINDGYSPEELLEASRNYAEQCKIDRTEQKFIKHGKTFLGDSFSFVEFISQKKEGKESGNGVDHEAEITKGTNPFRK